MTFKSRRSLREKKKGYGRAAVQCCEQITHEGLPGLLLKMRKDTHPAGLYIVPVLGWEELHPSYALGRRGRSEEEGESNSSAVLGSICVK